METDASIQDPLRVRRVMAVSLRIGAILLASGSQTTDIESILRRLTAAFGLPGVQAVVSFSTISLSWIAPGDLSPTTVIHMVRDRGADFAKLAAAADLVREVADGDADLDAAEAAAEHIESTDPTYPGWVTVLAPGVSGAATTILFGGNLLEGAVTLGIGLLIQPFIGRLARSAVPPFFRIAAGVLATTLLVVVLAELQLPISASLVLTGGILRFLPGNALVSGVRDLIDQSIVSGTARLAEAILLGAAVAAGAGAGVVLASMTGVSLGLTTTGMHDWGIAVSVVAAIVAVGTYAIQLGVPTFALVAASLLGALASQVSAILPWNDAALATFVAATVVGAVGRWLADRHGSPANLWVVPAILTLLPGLSIVQALLAPTGAAQVAGLVGAIATAFALGVGVAAGDILMMTLGRFRTDVVAPAVDVVQVGVDVLVAKPIARVAAPITDHLGRPAAAGTAATDPGDADEAAPGPSGPPDASA